MTGRKDQGWQGVALGLVMIVVGVVLLARHVPVFGVTALPIVAAGIPPLLIGLHQLYRAGQARPEKEA